MGKKLCEKEKRKKGYKVIRYECTKCDLVSDKEKHLCKARRVKN